MNLSVKVFSDDYSVLGYSPANYNSSITVPTWLPLIAMNHESVDAIGIKWKNNKHQTRLRDEMYVFKTYTHISIKYTFQ